ncbi:MAG TPA: ABC transporter permease, partial [Gemmataceae bacterium]|nr:ABC transporter permease [Gemmataceae bacterium]
MGRHLRLLWALARNDWRLFLADRRAAALCFIVPVLLASVFGLIFDRPSRPMGAAKLPLLLVLDDDSPAARAVVDALLAGGRVDGRVVDRTTAEREVEARACGVAVVLREVDRKLAVEVLHHPLCALEGQWAEGVVTEAVVKQFLAPTGVPVETRPFQVTHSTLPAAAGQAFNSYSHSFCGMTLQYVLFWGLESGLLYLRERQRGLWRRMRAAPVPLVTALLGRGFATAAIALLQILATFAFGRVVFGVTVEGSG